eukprot:m.295604 g.295604  ORF g.295604 m.295604 type:complete len:93 (+) comp20042_c0_seq1:32-310(+)
MPPHLFLYIFRFQGTHPISIPHPHSDVLATVTSTATILNGSCHAFSAPILPHPYSDVLATDETTAVVVSTLAEEHVLSIFLSTLQRRIPHDM